LLLMLLLLLILGLSSEKLLLHPLQWRQFRSMGRWW